MSAHSLTDDQVVHLYLSGYMSGVASFLIQQGAPEDQAEAFARHSAKHIEDDPVAYHQLSEQLIAWLDEKPTRPRSTTITAYTMEDPS